MKKCIFALILLTSAGCATTTPLHAQKISIDAGLMEKSDNIDIVQEDGSFSYVSYLMKEDLREDSGIASCDHLIGASSHTQKYAIWLWDLRKIAGKEQEVVSRLRRDLFSRVYLQISRDLEAVRPFLREAAAAGIEVFALDGESGHIDDWSYLADDIRRVSEFNASAQGYGFAGIQFDVEPYLKKDFNLRRQHYADQYLKMASELKRLSDGKLKLSFALPFWFHKLLVQNKPLSFLVIDIADEVVLMSYRTTYEDLVSSALADLCYAGAAGKPLFLGLEVTRLPDEHHYVVARDDVYANADRTGNVLTIEGASVEKLKPVRTYVVKSEKLSFFRNRDRLSPILKKGIPYKSFSGFVIHSYEGFYE